MFVYKIKVLERGKRVIVDTFADDKRTARNTAKGIIKAL